MRLRTLSVRLVAIAIVIVFGVTAVWASAALTTVNTMKNTALGGILVSANGRTLYHDSAEQRNVVRCTGPCATVWPPLLISGSAKPAAGAGVNKALLGTVKRPNGTMQVTYRGLPLYLYSGDKKPGEVNGQGSAGIWHALTPGGVVILKSVTASAGSAGSGSSTGSSSATGSSGSTTGSGNTGGTTGNTGGTTGTGTAGTGTGTTGATDCATNPGGYGCM
jgi:predicted lipoprotein with Yx(FWY)xxD motif